MGKLIGMPGYRHGSRTQTVKCPTCWVPACGAMTSMLIMEYLEGVRPVRSSTKPWLRSSRATRW